MNLFGVFLPLPFAISLISSCGCLGLLFLFWLVWIMRNNARHDNQVESEREYRALIDKSLAQNKEAVDSILNQYKADVDKVTGYYERNVELVENYAKLADSLAEIIHLNTQIQTRLVESINNNRFCPVVRDAGPQRGN